LNGTDISANKIRDIWTWWRRKWFSGGMMVVGFSQELLEIISRWMIRSKCDRNPGFFARDGLERERHG